MCIYEENNYPHHLHKLIQMWPVLNVSTPLDCAYITYHQYILHLLPFCKTQELEHYLLISCAIISPASSLEIIKSIIYQ